MAVRGRYSYWGTVSLFCLLAAPSLANDAETTSFKPRLSGDIRLRYQQLDSDAFAQNADALTARLSSALEIDIFEKTSFLAELEGVTALIDDFNDGTGNNPLLPLIPDPNGFELNRLQIITEAIPKTRLTIGRQRLALDDWRFIGAFPFRQNNQSIEAIRVETTAFGPGILDVGYFNKVRRPLGADNVNGLFSGDSFFTNYNLATPLGRLSAFYYATELETGPKGLSRKNLSSQTTGVRVLGRRDWQDISLVWEGSYALQKDYADNPKNYAADYGLAEIAVKPGAFALKLRGEILGSDNGQALQTPLASLHRFQGFADQFLKTPDDGVRDYSILAQYNLGQIGPVSNVTSFARHHWFKADTDGRDYGRELNLSLKGRVNKVGLALEYANYKAETFSNDTKTFFLTTEISF